MCAIKLDFSVAKDTTMTARQIFSFLLLKTGLKKWTNFSSQVVSVGLDFLVVTGTTLVANIQHFLKNNIKNYGIRFIYNNSSEENKILYHFSIKKRYMKPIQDLTHNCIEIEKKN